MKELFGIFSNFMRYARTNYSKFHSFVHKAPFYRLTLLSFLPRSIHNKLTTNFPSEYSIDLISQSHIIVLKCSGKTIFIRDIPHMLVSSSLSNEEKLELHTFSWISLLDLDMDRHWRIIIRNHIKFWIENFKSIKEMPWDIHNVSERIYNWIIRYNLISKTSDKNFNTYFLKSLLQQLKFLKRQLYLPLKISEKTSLIRALSVGYAAIDNSQGVSDAFAELIEYLKSIDSIKSCKTTQEILKVLRNLIDIQAIILFYKKKIPQELSEVISKLTSIIRKIRHSDGGISIFQSEFTPSPTYIDALISQVRKIDSEELDSGYLRFQFRGGVAFINLRNKYFPIEFSDGAQRIILGSYLHFADQKLSFSDELKIEHSVHNEKNNIWFSGKSSFSINDHDIMFWKNLYINNLGNDIRNEEIMSTESFNITHYIILPDEISITPLEYQNGFFMDLKTGTRWVWNFNKNAKFSFDFEKKGILNGGEKRFSILAITTNSPDKNVLRWSLKKL